MDGEGEGEGELTHGPAWLGFRACRSVAKCFERLVTNSVTYT